jgi:succinate dehydrogenase/fumarate reductase flavoprotein subunit
MKSLYRLFMLDASLPYGDRAVRLKSVAELMSAEPTKPFDSIESAHEFVALLEESIQEAADDIRDHLRQAEADHAQRQVDALNLALYKLTQLAAQMHKSRRALNDLRSIRRLLFTERDVDESTPL